jgi:CheY-like chemotaxis protein
VSVHQFNLAAILIATDEVARANLVRNILLDEFKTVSVSMDPQLIAQDFKQARPAVLVLAFATLEQSEQYFQKLYRTCKSALQHPHRTLILCGHNDIKTVYTLCKKGYFNDYLLFWPRPDDPLQFCMSIYHLLRELEAMTDYTPSAARFAALSRGLGGQESLLDAQLAKLNQYIALVERTLERSEEELITDVDHTPNSEALREGITAEFRRINSALLPLRRWSDELKRALTPLTTVIRNLNALAKQVQPMVLVVDDDELQCKVIETVLKEENYRLVFAASGLEALSLLRQLRPDVVLMDVRMPDMDGITATQRLKALPQFAQLPVIMITGHSEKAVVVDSLRAGATGFLVKPFGRDTLITKLREALGAP